MNGEVAGIRKTGMIDARDKKLWAVEVVVSRDDVTEEGFVIGDTVRLTQLVATPATSDHASHCHKARPSIPSDRLTVSVVCCEPLKHTGSHTSCQHAAASIHDEGCHSW